MKAKTAAALLMTGIVAWSVAQRQRAPQNSASPSHSWRLDEVKGRDLASRAGAVLQSAGHQSALLARGLGRRAGEGASVLPSLEMPSLLSSGQAVSAVQIAAYEKQLCDLANRERVQRGLPALKISPVLAEIARAHSREMAARNYFAHESPTPGLRSPMDRYRARVKQSPRLIAENIYKVQGSGMYRLKAADFRGAHTGWMHSPGHRANILRSQPAGGPTQIGVGIVVRGSSFWATQNFARP